MIIGYITHEEAMVRRFMRDPEFAEFMLQEAMAEGDFEEVQLIKSRMREAKARLADMAEAVTA